MIYIIYVDIFNMIHKKCSGDNVILFDLPRKEITKIINIDKLVNLQEFFLPHNNILVGLQKLNLYDNMITMINGLDNLVNLQELDLCRNKITEIKGLDNLVNLQKIGLSCNKITEIQNIDNLVNLHTLYLSYNIITEIEGLHNLVNLQILY